MNFLKTATGALAGILMMMGGTAVADDWAPDGTVTLQIGFGAGGSTDTIGRVIAKVMKDQTGWNIIAENKTGGGGMAMFTGIANMPPNGNVIGMGVSMPVLINLVQRPTEVAFDLDSFAYLGSVSRAQVALVARADAPFDDIAGMVEYSKTNDGAPVAFDAAPQKLLMEIVNKDTDAGFRFVSTESEAETHKLLLGGQVLAGFSAGTHVDFLKSGDFKMIASGNDGRHSYAPETPTFREEGFNAYVDPYFYFATTAGTDPAAVEAMTAALANAIASDEVSEIVAKAALTDVINLGPEGTKQMLVDGIENVKVLFGK